MSADGKTLTIVCEVAEQPFNSMLTTRVTHSYINEMHQAHQRRIQSSNAAIFCEAPGGNGATVKAAILNEALADIFAALEPLTTFLPQLKKLDDGKVHVISETPVTFQWQISTDGKTWSDLTGETKSNITEGLIKPGEWSRLAMTNSTGTNISKAVQKPLPAPPK